MEIFRNKVVWITGASSGLGEAMAYAFGAAGAKVILSARREENLLNISSKTQDSKVLIMDMEKPNEFPTKVQEAIQSFGHIDILINNAGIAQRSMAEETDPDVERKIMNVDYFAHTELTRLVIPHFKRKKSGHIVVISGLIGQIYLPGRTSYAAAKCALLGYFGCLNAEQAKNNIKVSMIIPGGLQSDLVNKALDKDGTTAVSEIPKSGCPLDKAAAQVLKAVAKGKLQAYIGDKDKPYIMWRLSRLYPNFVAKMLIKQMG